MTDDSSTSPLWLTGRVLARLVQFNRVLWSYVLLPLIFPAVRKGSQPEAVRAALVELGGTWVKLGQMLALRFDLVPPEYCYEFFKLLNEVRPFPYDQVRCVVERDLGRPPEELFRRFDPEPFAGASIGQVHHAVLHSGERVVVKVQRPNIRRIMAADITLMRILAAVLDFVRVLPFRSGEIVDEFARWTAEELDYRSEARHARLLRLNAQGDPMERHPAVYEALSSERVLTMEEIVGIPLIDIIFALGNDQDRDAYVERLKREGHDLDRIAAHLAWNSLNQIYRFGYFHADLHPANLFVMKDDAIGYVDYGITSTLDPETRDSIAYYAYQLQMGRIDAATDEYMRWLTPSESTNVENARSELYAALDEFWRTTRYEKSVSRVPLLVLEAEMLGITRRNDMGLSPKVVLYTRAIMTLLTIADELSAGFNMWKYQERFFSRALVERARNLADPRRLAPALFEYQHWFRRQTPREFSSQSNQSMELTVRRVRRRVQLLTVAVVFVAIMSYLYMTHPITHFLEDVLHLHLNWLPPALLVIYVILGIAMWLQGRKLRRAHRSRVRIDPSSFRARWRK